MSTVIFLPVEPVVENGVSVMFPAEIDGQQIKCAITSEALCDRFGGHYHDPLSPFMRHRQTIEKIATKLINQERFEPNGTILIRTQDI